MRIVNMPVGHGRIGRRQVMSGLGLLGLGAALPAALGGIAADAAGPLLQVVPGAPMAPEFSLADLDGALRTMKEFKGRVVIANFWATWCPPCRAEIPSMQRAWEALESEGVVVLGLHVGGIADEIWTFLADMNVTFPVLIDASGDVSRAWGTVGLPTTYVVDGVGRKVLKAIGERAWDDPAIIAQLKWARTLVR